MVTRGHEITLLCPAESQIFRAAPRYGLSAVALPIARKNLRGLLALRRWLAVHAQDIAIINTHSSTDTWLAALACQTMKNPPPLLRTRHVSSSVSKNVPTYWLYQKAVKHIVVTGEALREQLARDNRYVPTSMTSVPTGIDLDRYRPRTQSECRGALGLPDGKLIGILATLRSWKGHVYLFEAMAALLPSFPTLRLAVIGDGPNLARYQQRVVELGIAHAVDCFGRQENAEIWLGALDVFVLPSYGDEGISQALMQAMATGLPVITTPIGGLAEMVTNDQTGLLVPPRDSQALVLAISRLLEDTALRQRLADAGFHYAREKCSLEKMLDSMEAIFLRHARRQANA